MKFSSKQYALALNQSLKIALLEQEDSFFNNFIKLLKLNKDLKKIGFIEKQLEKLYSDEKQEIKTKITVPYPLSEEIANDIKNVIIKFLDKKTKTINLEQKIDKDIIGGFKAEIDDLLIDASLRNVLLKLKKNL